MDHRSDEQDTFDDDVSWKRARRRSNEFEDPPSRFSEFGENRKYAGDRRLSRSREGRGSRTRSPASPPPRPRRRSPRRSPLLRDLKPSLPSHSQALFERREFERRQPLLSRRSRSPLVHRREEVGRRSPVFRQRPNPWTKTGELARRGEETMVGYRGNGRENGSPHPQEAGGSDPVWHSWHTPKQEPLEEAHLVASRAAASLSGLMPRELGNVFDLGQGHHHRSAAAGDPDEELKVAQQRFLDEILHRLPNRELSPGAVPRRGNIEPLLSAPTAALLTSGHARSERREEGRDPSCSRNALPLLSREELTLTDRERRALVALEEKERERELLLRRERGDGLLERERWSEEAEARASLLLAEEEEDRLRMSRSRERRLEEAETPLFPEDDRSSASLIRGPTLRSAVRVVTRDERRAAPLLSSPPPHSPPRSLRDTLLPPSSARPGADRGRPLLGDMPGSSPKKGPLLGAGRRGLLGSTPEDDALLRRKTRRDSDRRGVALRVANIPPELDTVDALEDLFAGYNLRSARPTEALVTLASMADAEAAAAFLEHMSFSTGQIKVTFEDDRGGAMASRPPPSPPSPPPLPLSRPPPLLGRGEIASGHQEGPQDVLVGKLPFGTTRRQVEDLFQDFQPREVEVFSGDTGIYAYLSFMEREAAESAVRAWNGKRYGDTRLLVEMYKERGATGRRV